MAKAYVTGQAMWLKVTDRTSVLVQMTQVRAGLQVRILNRWLNRGQLLPQLKHETIVHVNSFEHMDVLATN